MLEISKNCGPRLDWINELQPKQKFDFCQSKGLKESPDPHLESFYLKRAYSFSSSLLSKRLIPHALLFIHPPEKAVLLFALFVSLYEELGYGRKDCQLLQVLSSEQVKAYWPMTAAVSSCRLSHSRAILSCSTFQLLVFTGKSDSSHNLDI